MNHRTLSRLCGFIALSIATTACHGGEEKLFKESKIIMGTVVEVTVAHHSEVLARAAINAAMEELRRADDLMSSSRTESVVSRINREGSSGKVSVGEEVFQLLQDSVNISRASNGAFDITILPVVDLWRFDQGGVLPEITKIAQELANVGYEKLILDDYATSVGFATEGMGLDLGAIAKGWAVDRAMERIVAHGVRNAIVDAGGDLRIIGARPGKDFWRIGVQHPREPGSLLVTFELRNTAIVTSGDYERFFMTGGVRYHHILDPATGQPARGSQSVTVLAPTATEADACATAAFVLGPEKGLAFLRTRPGVRGFIVSADGALHWSDDALERMVRR